MWWPKDIWGKYAGSLEDFKDPAHAKDAVACLNDMVSRWLAGWPSRALLLWRSQRSSAPEIGQRSAALAGDVCVCSSVRWAHGRMLLPPKRLKQTGLPTCLAPSTVCLALVTCPSCACLAFNLAGCAQITNALGSFKESPRI